MAKAKAKARPKKQPAKPKPKAKAKPRAKPKAKAKPATKKKPAPKPKPKPKRKAAPKPAFAPKPASGGGHVVGILEAEDPIGALRAFVAKAGESLSVIDGQVLLGAAQLMLLPIAREGRGGPEVKDLLDLVLEHWDELPDRAGFHAREFLRNAFAAVGDDPDRIAELVARIPDEPNAELLFNLACAYAVAGDRAAMLVAAKQALAAGASAAQFRRDHDFLPYAADPELAAVLDAAERLPEIPVDVEPHVARVREALDELVATMREYGETVELNPPATLDAILAAERARKMSLPNDYRAFLTLANGMRVWDEEFLGTADYTQDTRLAGRARQYLEMSADYGATGIEDLIPLANCGSPNNWLFYDPRGAFRHGAPGYVVMLNADEWPQEDLVERLERIAKNAREILSELN